MAEGEIKNYLIGIVIFMGLITGTVHIMASFNVDNPQFLDQEKFSKFNATFNKMAESDDQITSVQNSIEGASTDPGLFGVLNALIMSAWTTLKNIFTSLSFMTAVFGGLYTIFGLPVWAGNMIVSIITIIIAFSIWGAIFQRQP